MHAQGQGYSIIRGAARRVSGRPWARAVAPACPSPSPTSPARPRTRMSGCRRGASPRPSGRKRSQHYHQHYKFGSVVSSSTIID
jgi:hypothetical protein